MELWEGENVTKKYKNRNSYRPRSTSTKEMVRKRLLFISRLLFCIYPETRKFYRSSNITKVEEKMNETG